MDLRPEEGGEMRNAEKTADGGMDFDAMMAEEFALAEEQATGEKRQR